ncbi:MAG: helix-turn-helix transcriptional regulator [Chloroflexi bacterium]|nr:helix-turn-helix transcriptional regulator [Chloroflexota bacterium]
MVRADREILDVLFGAVSDRTRRHLFERVAERPGMTTGELAGTVTGLTRYAVMKHLEVLRRAGLVQTLPEGRRRRHYGVERALEPAREWLESQAGPLAPS